jgi:hypothetical protein
MSLQSIIDWQLKKDMLVLKRGMGVSLTEWKVGCREIERKPLGITNLLQTKEMPLVNADTDPV